MSNTHRPEDQEFYNGKSRPTAIRDYLNLNRKFAREVARLAASMATASKTFDPSALVSAALALRVEADAGLVRHREELVGSMNLRTLLDLAHKLGVEDKIHANENDDMFSDPVAGPVLRILKRLISKKSADRAAQNAARIDKVLANADSRTKLQRPALPCNLEVALRYAANAPDCPWPLLERAFTDFLGIYQSPSEAERERDCGEDIKNELDREQKILASMKSKAKTDPDIQSSESEQKAKVNTLTKTLREWKTVQIHRELFMPGKEPPPSIAEKSAMIYEESWHAPGIVSKNADIAFLATKFHDFWQQHSKDYLRLHKELEARKIARGRDKQEFGAKGSLTRDHGRRLRQMEAFISFLNKDEARRMPAKIQDSVRTFVHNYGDLKDKEAKAKLADFLSTLCNAAFDGSNASDILPVLRKCGIKAISRETISECLKLLNRALKRGPVKM